MIDTPEQLDRNRVETLLSEIRTTSDVGTRIEKLSARFVGFPYRDHPLIGSENRPEVFTAALDGFDCVTYVESVLALARSHTVDQFTVNLRQIRYAGGHVSWRDRNHYMSAWIRRNDSSGIVRNCTRGPGVVERIRRLSVVCGLPVQSVKVRSIQKQAWMRRQNEVRTGDLAFFASTRRDLDAFHCGILIRRDAGLSMRHAARSRGRVVEQNLAEFLSANRMTGVILVRPREAFDEAA